jgi:hypothetical protein
MSLAVQLKGPTPELSRTLRFSESPVRIGRNQLNDIPLDDPFVSEWHGIIRFTGQDVAYVDLGSTNGSVLDGQRLAKNQPAPLTGSSRLQLGRIELSVSPAEPQEEAGPLKTLGWGRESLRPPGVATPRAGGVLLGAASQSGVTTPTPGRAASGATTGSAAGASASKPIDAAVLARHRRLLEAFCEAFVGLRKGYEQLGAEVGVRTVSGRTALHRARTSHEVLEHLLNPAVDPDGATRELIAIFADFGIHHIAMMEGVTEGVRSLLHSLAPPEKKSQWKEYVERFDHAVNDDQELHDGIFGAEFARAYATVAGGSGGKRGNDRG